MRESIYQAIIATGVAVGSELTVMASLGSYNGMLLLATGISVFFGAMGVKEVTKKDDQLD